MEHPNDSALQKALREGMSLTEIQMTLGIRVKQSLENPGLYLFVYDQIDSPKLNPIVRSARGHILDENDNWAHVCRPFDRFYNWGEGVQQGQPVPNLGKAVVFKKEDGSLLNLHWYGGTWKVSTKGSPDASGEVGDYNITFAELFWRVFYAETTVALESLDKSKTYTFELCTMLNRVVCSQAEDRIVLLGIRSNKTGEEVPPNKWGEYIQGVPYCESYELDTHEKIVETFRNLKALEMEGYVVAEYLADGGVHRAKVKHPGYLALAHLKEGSTKKNFLNLIRKGEEGDEKDFLTAYPEYTPVFDDLRAKLEDLSKVLEEAWEKYKGIEVQKDFALAIREVPFAGILFRKRKSPEYTIKHGLADVELDALMKALQLKN